MDTLEVGALGRAHVGTLTVGTLAELGNLRWAHRNETSEGGHTQVGTLEVGVLEHAHVGTLMVITQKWTHLKWARWGAHTWVH